MMASHHRTQTNGQHLASRAERALIALICRAVFVSVFIAAISTSLVADESWQETWRKAISNDRVEELASLWESTENRQRLQELLELRTDNGKNAFMIAAKTGNHGLFESLLAAGADPDARTATGGTPIMFAVLGNHGDIVNRLLEEGVDVNAQGSNGWSALTIAAAKGYSGLITLLSTRGADINATDVYRWSPLMRAVDNGHDEVVDRMLSLDNLDLLQQDEAGNTALHYAVVHNNVHMAKALLAAGADPEIENLQQQTPRDLVLSRSASKELMELF